MRLRSLWLFLLFSLPLAAADDVTRLTQLAQEQNPQAQYQLALTYQTGSSTPQNLNEAFYWFLQSAELNHPPAMAQVANAYLTGQGVEKRSTASPILAYQTSSGWKSSSGYDLSQVV